jgi:hypothetical protein
MLKRISPILLLLAFSPLAVFAQQTGASVTGHVLDPSGAAISEASIKITSTTTGAVYTAGSDSSGIYQLPFVLIGTYTLTVEKQGFKKYVQEGIALLGGEKAVVDVTLQLGAIAQSVTVVANAPILQPESGDRNATISNIRLDPEVFRGQNTIITTWFTPGQTLTAAVQKERPWDNAGSQASSFNGGQMGDNNGSGIGGLETGQQSANSVMVDGVSVNRNGLGVGFNPIAATVDQVIVQGTMYDAQFGWSTGGHVNTLTKGGSNTWHGHAYDYLQNTLLNAEDYASQQAVSPAHPNGTGRLPWHINMFGGEVGGPLKKDKIFVYYAYSLIWQIQRDPFITTVPTAAEKQGNFNGVTTDNTSGVQVTIYDPSTTGAATAPESNCATSATVACRLTTGPLVANNIIQSVNPIAHNILNIIPLANVTPLEGPCPTGVAGPCGTFANGDITGPSDRKFVDYFPQHSGRIDWNFNDRTHAFFRFSKNDLAETRSYVYSTVSAINPAETSGNNPLFRGNQAYVLQITHTFNPTTVLEFRTGMDRYPNGSGDSTVSATDAAALGFSPTYESEVGHYFPQINATGYGNTSNTVAGSTTAMAGGVPLPYDASDIWNHEVVVAHTKNKHNIRFGYQRFDLAEYVETPGNVNGIFAFNGYFTDLNPNLPGTSIPSWANSLADFELGMPFTGSINQPAYPEYWEHEHSLFVQDDYHLSRKLTVNMGLRWDYEGSVHDKYNRLLNGFCFSCQNPIGYIPGLGNLLGGPTYAGVGGAPSGIFNRKYDNFGPRVGFAYDMGHDTVLRGGWGVIYGQQILQLGAAPGFTQTTQLNSVPGAAGIFNPNISLANPFPSGLAPIVGSANGLAANIGKGITFGDPNFDIPRTQQYSLEFQHRLGTNWMISLAYVGSRTSRLLVNQNLDYVPLADLPWTRNFTINPTGYTVKTLNTPVTNPFQGYIPAQYASLATGTYMAGSTISKSQSLLPYPQFSGVTEDWVPIGKSHYNSMQFEVNKRLSMGLEFSFNVTWSKTLEALGFLSPQDPFPAQTIAAYDVPLQSKINFAYFAPFGPGKRFLNQTNPVVSRLVSGWSLSATPMLEQGFPVPVPSGVMPTGANPKTPNPTLAHWFNTCTLLAPTISAANVNTDILTPPAGNLGSSCTHGDSTPAWQQTIGYQLTEWGPFMSNLRYPGFHRLDASIKKETSIKERFQLTFRADFINAFNSMEWFTTLDLAPTDPAFGAVAKPSTNTPSDDPRVIELSLQLKF